MEGLRNVVPEDARASWGARTILDSDSGFVDIVHDRTSHEGDKSSKRVLIDELKAADESMRSTVKELVLAGMMEPNKREEFVLYESDTVKMVGNTNASYGYLYIAAWLKAEA